jgi:hypothetical protein
MDHHEVEMDQRAADDVRAGRVAVQVVGELPHKHRHLFDVRAFVHDLARRIVADVNRPGSPPARSVLERVAGRHVVQALEQLVAVGEVVVLGAFDAVRSLNRARQ